jgi:hypothetical protein
MLLLILRVRRLMRLRIVLRYRSFRTSLGRCLAVLVLIIPLDLAWCGWWTCYIRRLLVGLGLGILLWFSWS